jgi:FKBP-type peptidyl-prolyl cis-trans isomerase
MSNMKKILSALVITTIMGMVSCKSDNKVVTEEPIMETSADSMSYAYGMELGRMLKSIDPALNIDLVCMGISDMYSGEPKLKDDEARYAVLKYMHYDNYERVKKYEDQYLAELRATDKEYYATTSGLTYKIRKMGDTQRGPKVSRDTIRMTYRVLDVTRVVDTTYYRNDTLRMAFGDMPKGVQEAARLVGRGGHIEAWVPSALAFGSAGCDSLGVEPNTMLYYELKIIDVER